MNLMASLDASTTIFSYLGLYGWLRPAVIWLSQLVGNKSLEYMQKFSDDNLAAAKAEQVEKAAPGAPVTMIRKLFNVQASGEQELSDYDIGLAAAANIAAGSDTTAIGLSSLVFHLYSSPQCLKKVREEIENHELPTKPLFKDVQKLPYFQAAVKESMRLNPGVGLPLWRVVPQGGIVIDGRHFPEGVSSNSIVRLRLSYRC